MAGENLESNETPPNRRRRRRRRRRRPEGNGAEKHHSGSGRRRGGGEPAPSIRLPLTGNLPHHRPPHHPSRQEVASSSARRRRLNRVDMDALAAYLTRLPDAMVGQLYKGMGGQPNRIANKERMIQLAVRAIAQGTRLDTLIRGLHQRDRQALAALVQVGGLAHHAEFCQELVLSLGGSDREWIKIMTSLGERGLVAASEVRGDDYFYIIPEPIMAHLVEHLHEDLTVPSFDHEDMKVVNHQPFTPPLDFSLVTLATYIDQHPPRLTQRQEIFKVHKDELDSFFSQLWSADSELFNFHIEFLMVHGMVELRGDRLSLNRSVLEEWLHLSADDQRDLVFTTLENRFEFAEWILWVINDLGGSWVPERPLQTLYRRWKRGEDWRQRFHSDDWKTHRTNQRESFSFTPLVTSGMLELGQWGQEKFYRLNPRGQQVITPTADEEFSQFYLTPSFEIMAPAGMSPGLFFRIGELAELTSCDRANTYKITEVTIERALEKGWRRDDILEFLRENSQIGLPENVEQTLRGWMGHHGDIEFHDVMLLTVHRSQIRKLESNRKLKPFLLHRFVPGMYAVDRSRMPQIMEALEEADFSPAKQVREYPGESSTVDARKRLVVMVQEARQERVDTLKLLHIGDTQPEDLAPVPGSAKTRSRRKRGTDMQRVGSISEMRDLMLNAIARKQDLKVIYVTRSEERKTLTLTPERVAAMANGALVLVAMDRSKEQRLSYQLTQIERLAAIDRRG